jgi:hypothetical protein
VNIIENIKSLFSRSVVNAKAKQLTAPLQFFANTIGANRVDFEQTQKLLSNYSFICINKISELVSSQKYYVGTYDKELELYNSVKESDNWLISLIDNNSLTMQINFNELLQLIIYWYYVEGNVYLWFRTSDYDGGVNAKYPVEIILLPSREVMINAGTYNLIDSYSITLNNKYITIPANQVCHIKTMSIPEGSDNQTYYYKGISKFNNAIKDVLEAYYLMLQNANTELNRQGVPNVVLTNASDQVSQIEVNNWQEAFNKRYGKYAPIVFGAEINTKYERMDIGNNILAQNTGAFAGGINTELKRLITATFGMPLDFIDGTPAYTSNYKEMKATIYEQTIEPLTISILQSINIHLKQFDNGMYSIQYVPFKYESLNDKVMIANTLGTFEAISKNELRELFGMSYSDLYEVEDIETDIEQVEENEPENNDEIINEVVNQSNELETEKEKIKSLIELEISKSIKKKVLSLAS